MADRHSAAPALAPNDDDDIRIPVPGGNPAARFLKE
jgi:hypothetical protein